MIWVTALMDNVASENKALLAEHGLSLLIQTPDIKLLFDAGQGEDTLYNARKLGMNLGDLDAVVLSHSHYDHAMGFRDLAELGLAPERLLTGPHFFEKKYAKKPFGYTDLSCGFDEEFLRDCRVTHEVIEDIAEIAPGVWAVTDFPRTHEFETIPERFVRNTAPEGELPVMVHDEFPDEVCLAVKTAKGICVFVGCSHPGILNMVCRVHEALGEPIYGVFGGTHLVEASEERIRQTVAELKSMGVKVLGFSHCSGACAEHIEEEDPEVESCHLAVGDCLFLEEANV